MHYFDNFLLLKQCYFDEKYSELMLEDESLPFLLVVAGRTAGNNQPRIKGNYFDLP